MAARPMVDAPGEGGPGTQSESDELFMRRAVELGERCRRAAAPNPWVGAVLVADDGETVLGEGCTSPPGGAHAEVVAFRDAVSRGASQDAIAKATLYTTLEPCHRGPNKRTSACDELVVSHKVRRCVVAVEDPDRVFGGSGLELMRSAGIRVDRGVGAEAVRRSLRPYFRHRLHGVPYVVLKIASSLDGCIGCEDGTSQWITKERAREDSHRLRADCQAIMIGSGTALQDKPSLTVRLPDDPSGLAVSLPLRVVLDTRGRVVEGPLMDVSMAPTLILTSAEHCSAAATERWKTCGVQHAEIELEDAEVACTAEPRLSLRAVLRELAKRGVLQLMVEGGAVLQGEFLKLGFADELRVYFGATLLGSSARRWATARLTGTIGEAKFWKLRQVRPLGDDVCLEYERTCTLADCGERAAKAKAKKRGDLVFLNE